MPLPGASVVASVPLLGEVRHLPAGPVVAGSYGTWSTEIRLARGLEPGARLALARRWASDWGQPQWDDPAAENYTTVDCGEGVTAELSFDRIEAWHPWDHVFRILIVHGEVPAGGRIIVCFGDRRGGGPGARAQTFIEEASGLSVRLAPSAEGEWTELARPAVPVIGGATVRLVGVAPSRVPVGEAFRLLVRAEDAWGNPAAESGRVVRVAAAGGVEAAEETLSNGIAAVPLRLTRQGLHRLEVELAPGDIRCQSNPIECSDAPLLLRTYWGDIHAQSSIGCGNRTIADYFAHARDVAGLDFASHQANDFLVSNQEWAETQAVTAQFNETGRFVTLLGIEWSGETRVGGDRNVYFSGDADAIRRSSHRHLPDRSDEDTDLTTVTTLQRHYHNADVLLVPHVGGRTADLSLHDDKLERLIEIHSTHATSEWFLTEALQRGMRVGVTAGSDGVDGRPGTSHPGAMGVRNLQGGLVAVTMPVLSREALWRALRQRHCYATTGERILLDFEVSGLAMGAEGPVEGVPLLRARVHGTAPLETVELFRGTTCIHSVPLIDAAPTRPDRIRVAWRGAAKPGNWQRARLVWDGELQISGTRIRHATGYAFDTPAEGLRHVAADTVAWRSITAGDWDGVVLDLEPSAAGAMRFRAAPATFELALADLADGPRMFEARGHEAIVEVRRLPAQALPFDWQGSFADRMAAPGLHPYWLRVRQADGSQAWASPVYATVGSRP